MPGRQTAGKPFQGGLEGLQVRNLNCRGGRGVCAPGRKHFLSFWRKRPPQADFFDKLTARHNAGPYSYL